MGYKKIEPVLQNIHNLAQECGLFTCETELNGGFGCLSKSKEKQEPGYCYKWDCPLVYEADLSDLKKLDTDLYLEYVNDLYPENIESDFVVQYQKL